jgi:hypothetical protein
MGLIERHSRNTKPTSTGPRRVDDVHRSSTCDEHHHADLACGARNVILSLYSYNPVFGLSRRLNSQRLSRPYKVHSAAHQSFQALVKLYSRASGFSFTWSATSRFKSASDSSFSMMFYRSHFSSASRCTANASGFLILNQCEFFGRFWARK